MESEPHLIGLASPSGENLNEALTPWPINSSGYRLWKLIQLTAPGFTDFDYVHNFRRLNLSNYPAPTSADVCKGLWTDIERAAPPHSVLIALGGRVRAAASLPADLPPMDFVVRNGRRITWLPNPSGRNHYFNDTLTKLAVSRFLYALVRRP